MYKIGKNIIYVTQESTSFTTPTHMELTCVEENCLKISHTLYLRELTSVDQNCLKISHTLYLRELTSVDQNCLKISHTLSLTELTSVEQKFKELSYAHFHGTHKYWTK